MPKLDENGREFAEAARKVYDEKLRADLEPEHNGKVIAVEPESGQYVLGASFKEVTDACRSKLGRKPVHIFCVGGGGVKLFGSRLGGRLLRRT